MKSIFKNLVMAVGLTSLVTSMAYGMRTRELQPLPRLRAEEQRDERVKFNPPAPSEWRRAETGVLDQDIYGRGVVYDPNSDIIRYPTDILAKLDGLRKVADDEVFRDAGMDRQRRLELVREIDREGIASKRGNGVRHNPERINPKYNPVGR